MAEIKEELSMDIEGTESDECPIKQVNLPVPKTDDPSMPVYTFRMWFLGIIACLLLSFVNQFFWYRTDHSLSLRFLHRLPWCHWAILMAKTVTKRVFLKGTRFECTLNPGPFSIKEHVMITMFANAGAGSVYATHILSAVKLYYKKSLGFIPAFILMMTTQVFFTSLPPIFGLVESIIYGSFTLVQGVCRVFSERKVCNASKFKY